MSSAVQNRFIGRLIVGAMSVDGVLDKREREKVARTLDDLGMGELISDVGAAIDEDPGDINLYEDCKSLMDSLGSRSDEVAPLVFRIITDVVASDRFVSAQEATYLSAMARRLGLSTEGAQSIFKQVMAERRGRLEVAGDQISEAINPQLKNLLSFKGAGELVGELSEDSLEDLMHKATDAMREGMSVSFDQMERALTILGLEGKATLQDAEEVWRSTIDNANLKKMADLGETFVSATLSKLTRINEAYKTVLHFHESYKSAKKIVG